MVKLSFLKRRKKKEENHCINCIFYDAEKKMCKKMWVPVAPDSDTCRYFKPIEE